MESPIAGIMVGIFVLIMLALGIALYIFMAKQIIKIAQKRGITENLWFGYVPILQYLLLIKSAGKPEHWLVFMLIPFVNFIILILLWVELIKLAGKEEWWVILMFIGGVNIWAIYRIAEDMEPIGQVAGDQHEIFA